MHGSHARTRVAAVLLAGCFLAGGCAGSAGHQKRVRLSNQADANAYLDEARQSPSADTRRIAINRLSRTAYLEDENAGRVVAEIAASDPSNAVRCAALLALGRSRPALACPVCLHTLREDVASRRSVERSESVRSAAVTTLLVHAEANAIPDATRPAVLETAARLVQVDRSRNVRQQAARLLGNFRDRMALQALIVGLEQRDFGVCYEAERSLERLTGQRFEHDPQAWRDYLAQTNDPFAAAVVVADDGNGEAGQSWFGWWPWSK